MEDGQGLSAAWGPLRSAGSRSSRLQLRAKSRRETHFRMNSPIWMGRTWWSTSCCSYVTRSCGMSVVTSCASVSERIRHSLVTV